MQMMMLLLKLLEAYGAELSLKDGVVEVEGDALPLGILNAVREHQRQLGLLMADAGFHHYLFATVCWLEAWVRHVERLRQDGLLTDEDVARVVRLVLDLAGDLLMVLYVVAPSLVRDAHFFEHLVGQVGEPVPP